MRSVSLRPEVMAFRRVPDVTTDPMRRRRISTPEHTEVVAVTSDEDWLALFADEKDARREPPTAELPLRESTARAGLGRCDASGRIRASSG